MTFGNASIRDGFNSRERREKTKYQVYIAVARNGENLKVQQKKPQASIEAREVKYCIQGDGLAMADEKIQRGGLYTTL